MSKIDLTVIDQMVAAQLSQNENEATIKALRPKVKEAVKELIRQQGKPADWTGILVYKNYRIRVQRPTFYTWEKNTNEEVTRDPNHSIYLQQLELQRQMNEQLKDMRADIKRTATKLENAHPSSESIKHGFTVAILREELTEREDTKYFDPFAEREDSEKESE
jgi:hypothetical protein